MISDYTTIHDWIMAQAEERDVFDVELLLTYPVPIDRCHVVAAAWDLVEDGWLKYGADAKFRNISQETWAPFDPFA